MLHINKMSSDNAHSSELSNASSSSSSSSSGLSANFNKLKALALELGVHSQRCA